MVDFSTSQLTWIIIGACSLGGTGYVSMSDTVSAVDKKLAVSINQQEAYGKSIEAMQKQLDRIEQKINETQRR